MSDRISLYLMDYPSARQEVELARYAEQRGFEAIWIGETRMARDAISILGAISYVTSKIKLGSAVINCWSRIASLVALTWATLEEMASERTILGIGAWWDPLASKAGVKRDEPLERMRDYVTIIRRLLNMETVTYKGKTTQVEDLYIDLGHGVPRTAKHVPVMIGATGPKMLELAGEIGDGVILNDLVPPKYTEEAIRTIERGAAQRDRKISEIDIPQVIDCSMDEDADKAINKMRHLVTMYLGQQPHFVKALIKLGCIQRSLADEVNEVIGGWPPKPGGLEKAMDLVDDQLIQTITASGTPEDCRKKVREYVKAGTRLPLICPVSENIEKMVDAFAQGYN